jgi:hypothetical protein
VAIPEVQVAILALWVLKVSAARPEHQEGPVVLECHQGHQVALHHNGAAVVIVVLILADLMVLMHG